MTDKPIDWSKPVQTRDGRPVEIKFTDGRGGFPIIGYVDTSIELRKWRQSGQFVANDHDSPLDLINVPEPVVLWVHKVRNGGYFISESGPELATRVAQYGNAFDHSIKIILCEGKSPQIEEVKP